MSDIKIGGSNGESAETYIGVFGEIWIDGNGEIRRSNGSTPGGVIIGNDGGGGGGASTWADLGDKNNGNGPLTIALGVLAVKQIKD